MCALYTVGYEGSDISTFIKKLSDNNVKTIIDVRELPISRKPGFSKTKLKDTLQQNSINYIHYPSLGSPREIRHELYNTKNYVKFFKDYRRYISKESDIIMDALNLAEGGYVCLMCFEKNYKLCHRSILSEIFFDNSNVIDKVINI